MTSLADVYNYLPPGLRPIAASLKGYYLRSWRYSGDTDRLVEEALARERWTAAQWSSWQEERLVRVLRHAARHVPYYQQYWRECGRHADVENLAAWPILEKAALRASPRAFLADNINLRTMFREKSSGTTGTPLELYWSLDFVRQWFALFEARWRKWYGVSRHDRWAILGGQLVVPVAQKAPPFWVWNHPMHQLYMSAYHLSPQLIPRYLDALAAYRVRYIWGYSSSLYSLAQGVLSNHRKDIQMAVVIANAEPLYAHQRQVIEEAFRCPVRETYGMSEAVTAASECEHQVLHTWPELGIIETVAGEVPVGVGGAGDLVCTGLLNPDMPLIRYRVGDRGTLESTDSLCRCGRSLPRLRAIEGRSDDVLLTRDGREVGRLDPVFKSGVRILEAQIIQESLDVIRLRVVPADGFTSASVAMIVEQLRNRLGPVEIVTEIVSHIPRTQNGKFRAVVCRLTAEERQQVLGPLHNR